MSTIALPLLVVGAVVLGALDRLGDPLDAVESGVPGRSDRGELLDSSRELLVVHVVPLLPPVRRGVHQADPVEHAEVLGHRLPGDRQLLAEARRRARAAREQQVEHPPAGRVADGRPEGGVDHHAHELATRLSAYVRSCGMKWSQPCAWSAYAASRTAASQPISRKPVSVIRSDVPLPVGVSSKTTSRELPTSASSSIACVHRKAKRRGGSDSTTVIATTLARGLASSPQISSPVAPGADELRLMSSGHHSLRCSGRLTTSKTTSGEAWTWISRSMLAYSMRTPGLVVQRLVADDGRPAG